MATRKYLWYLVKFAAKNHLMLHSFVTVHKIVSNYLSIQSDLYGYTPEELMDLDVPVFNAKMLKYYEHNGVKEFWAGYKEWCTKMHDTIEFSK